MGSPQQRWGGSRWAGRCGHRVPSVYRRPHSYHCRPFSWLHNVLPHHCPVCQVRNAGFKDAIRGTVDE